MSVGQTGNTGQAGNSGWTSDWRAWALGVASAALAGLVVLAFEKQQWIWVVGAIAVTVTVVLFLAFLQGSGNIRMAFAFLAVGVVLGLVLTSGVVGWKDGSTNQHTSNAASSAADPSLASTSPRPKANADELKVTFEVPAYNASVPISGTVASGAIQGQVPYTSKLWFVKFSADNGGR